MDGWVAAARWPDLRGGESDTGGVSEPWPAAGLAHGAVGSSRAEGRWGGALMMASFFQPRRQAAAGGSAGPKRARELDHDEPDAHSAQRHQLAPAAQARQLARLKLSPKGYLAVHGILVDLGCGALVGLWPARVAPADARDLFEQLEREVRAMAEEPARHAGGPRAAKAMHRPRRGATRPVHALALGAWRRCRGLSGRSRLWAAPATSHARRPTLQLTSSGAPTPTQVRSGGNRCSCPAHNP